MSAATLPAAHSMSSDPAVFVNLQRKYVRVRGVTLTRGNETTIITATNTIVGESAIATDELNYIVMNLLTAGSPAAVILLSNNAYSLREGDVINVEYTYSNPADIEIALGAYDFNALSEVLTVEVKQNKKVYRQTFEHGNKTSELDVVGTTNRTGTKIYFKPDPKIFDTTVYDYDVLEHRLRELAFLNKGVAITLKDERPGQEQTGEYHYAGGIRSYIEYMNRNKDPLYPQITYYEKAMDEYALELAFQYTRGYQENIYSYANNIYTPEGGTHLNGFKSALTRTINNYARKAGLLKQNDKNLSGDDVREGLTAVISIKLLEPQFEGQTKTKLGDIRVLV